MAPDPLFVCRALGGVATAAQLAANGVPRRAVGHALDAGRLRRVRQGVVGDPALPAPVLHALGHGGRIACHSLLAARGVWTLEDARLHLHLPGGRHLHRGDECTPVVHRSSRRGEGGPLAVSVVSALAELARCAEPEHLVVALDSARHLGLLQPGELPLLRIAVPAAARAVVDRSTELADSGLESLIRWRLHLRGIDAKPQVVLGDGRRRDLLVGERLLIEADGGTHEDAAQHREDMRRDAYAVAAGYVVLRFGYGQVLHAWPATEAAIFSLIGRGLHFAAPPHWPEVHQFG